MNIKQYLKKPLNDNINIVDVNVRAQLEYTPSFYAY